MEKVILVLATLSLLHSVYQYVSASRIRGLLTMHLPIVKENQHRARTMVIRSFGFGALSFILFLSSGRVTNTSGLLVAMGCIYLIAHVVFVMKYSGKVA